MFMVIQFGLSLYVFLFLEQLLYDEPETFVDKFCIGYEDVEDAYYMLFLSIIFFVLHIISSCIYCCLLRIATNDLSILQTGQQRILNAQDRQPLNAHNQNQRRQPVRNNQRRMN